MTLLEPTADDDLADLTQALKEMDKAEPDYRKAEQYYEGDIPEVFASARLKMALRRNNLDFDLDFAAVPVDAVAERLEITSVTSEDQAHTDLIARVQTDNQFALQASNVMRKACTFGDAYLLVWPDPDEQTKVRMLYHDPRTARMFYDPEDPLRPKFVAKRWQDGTDSQPSVRVDLYYHGRIVRYVTRKDGKGTTAADFEPYEGDSDDQLDESASQGHIITHGYGLPWFHFRTDADTYGKPEHKRFYGCQDAIHKLILGHLAGVDYQSFPQRYALMDDASDSTEPADLTEGEFAIDFEPEGDTRPPGRDASSQLGSDPGDVWWLQGVKGVGQFDQADPTIFTGPIGDYITWGAVLSTTPLNRFKPAGMPASGESLKIVDGPFIKKIRNRQLSFGNTWDASFGYALTLLGATNPVVTTNWAPPASSDNATDWQVAQAKQAAGVPVSQTLMENGYGTDQVDEWMAKGQADLPQRLGNLVQIGEFLASAATAASVGLVDPDQVQAILASVMGDLSDSTRTA